MHCDVNSLSNKCETLNDTRVRDIFFIFICSHIVSSFILSANLWICVIIYVHLATLRNLPSFFIAFRSKVEMETHSVVYNCKTRTCRVKLIAFCVGHGLNFNIKKLIAVNKHLLISTENVKQGALSSACNNGAMKKIFNKFLKAFSPDGPIIAQSSPDRSRPLTSLRIVLSSVIIILLSKTCYFSFL